MSLRSSRHITPLWKQIEQTRREADELRERAGQAERAVREAREKLESIEREKAAVMDLLVEKEKAAQAAANRAAAEREKRVAAEAIVEQHAAANAARRDADEARHATCCIGASCDDCEVGRGITCASGHFTCRSCFVHYIHMRTQRATQTQQIIGLGRA